LLIKYVSLHRIIDSGSNGNCYYVGNATEGVLIDAGISFVKRKGAEAIRLSMRMVKAIFITHELRITSMASQISQEILSTGLHDGKYAE